MAKFEESKHPRDSDGKFTDGNGSQDGTPKMRKTPLMGPPIEWDDMSAEEMSKSLRRDISLDSKPLTKTRKPAKMVMLPKDLYAEFDSTIRTRYGNKIPNEGYVLLYNPIKGYNFFMIFSHNDRDDRNVCIKRLDLDSCREEINRILQGGKKKK